ncbi:unnamed protein product [Amoebophrya sp. A120]|nr:unnamed protein product [Amoebophrya sp. A120]|eukprot:GSA120T00004072001.1
MSSTKDKESGGHQNNSTISHKEKDHHGSSGSSKSKYSSYKKEQSWSSWTKVDKEHSGAGSGKHDNSLWHHYGGGGGSGNSSGSSSSSSGHHQGTSSSTSYKENNKDKSHKTSKLASPAIVASNSKRLNSKEMSSASGSSSGAAAASATSGGGGSAELQQGSATTSKGSTASSAPSPTETSKPQRKSYAAVANAANAKSNNKSAGQNQKPGSLGHSGASQHNFHSSSKSSASGGGGNGNTSANSGSLSSTGVNKNTTPGSQLVEDMNAKGAALLGNSGRSSGESPTTEHHSRSSISSQLQANARHSSTSAASTRAGGSSSSSAASSSSTATNSSSTRGGLHESESGNNLSSMPTSSTSTSRDSWKLVATTWKPTLGIKSWRQNTSSESSSKRSGNINAGSSSSSSTCSGGPGVGKSATPTIGAAPSGWLSANSGDNCGASSTTGTGTSKAGTGKSASSSKHTTSVDQSTTRAASAYNKHSSVEFSDATQHVLDSKSSSDHVVDPRPGSSTSAATTGASGGSADLTASSQPTLQKSSSFGSDEQNKMPMKMNNYEQADNYFVANELTRTPQRAPPPLPKGASHPTTSADLQNAHEPQLLDDHRDYVEKKRMKHRGAPDDEIVPIADLATRGLQKIDLNGDPRNDVRDVGPQEVEPALVENNRRARGGTNASNGVAPPFSTFNIVEQEGRPRQSETDDLDVLCTDLNAEQKKDDEDVDHHGRDRFRNSIDLNMPIPGSTTSATSSSSSFMHGMNYNSYGGKSMYGDRKGGKYASGFYNSSGKHGDQQHFAAGSAHKGGRYHRSSSDFNDEQHPDYGQRYPGSVGKYGSKGNKGSSLRPPHNRGGHNDDFGGTRAFSNNFRPRDGYGLQDNGRSSSKGGFSNSRGMMPEHVGFNSGGGSKGGSWMNRSSTYHDDRGIGSWNANHGPRDYNDYSMHSRDHSRSGGNGHGNNMMRGGAGGGGYNSGRGSFMSNGGGSYNMNAHSYNNFQGGGRSYGNNGMGGGGEGAAADGPACGFTQDSINKIFAAFDEKPPPAATEDEPLLPVVDQQRADQLQQSSGQQGIVLDQLQNHGMSPSLDHQMNLNLPQLPGSVSAAGTAGSVGGGTTSAAQPSLQQTPTLSVGQGGGAPVVLGPQQQLSSLPNSASNPSLQQLQMINAPPLPAAVPGANGATTIPGNSTGLPFNPNARVMQHNGGGSSGSCQQPITRPSSSSGTNPGAVAFVPMGGSVQFGGSSSSTSMLNSSLNATPSNLALNTGVVATGGGLNVNNPPLINPNLPPIPQNNLQPGGMQPQGADGFNLPGGGPQQQANLFLGGAGMQLPGGALPGVPPSCSTILDGVQQQMQLQSQGQLNPQQRAILANQYLNGGLLSPSAQQVAANAMAAVSVAEQQQLLVSSMLQQIGSSAGGINAAQQISTNVVVPHPNPVDLVNPQLLNAGFPPVQQLPRPEDAQQLDSGAGSGMPNMLQQGPPPAPMNLNNPSASASQPLQPVPPQMNATSNNLTMNMSGIVPGGLPLPAGAGGPPPVASGLDPAAAVQQMQRDQQAQEAYLRAQQVAINARNLAELRHSPHKRGQWGAGSSGGKDSWGGGSGKGYRGNSGHYSASNRGSRAPSWHSMQMIQQQSFNPPPLPAPGSSVNLVHGGMTSASAGPSAAPPSGPANPRSADEAQSEKRFPWDMYDAEMKPVYNKLVEFVNTTVKPENEKESSNSSSSGSGGNTTTSASSGKKTQKARCKESLSALGKIAEQTFCRRSSEYAKRICAKYEHHTRAITCQPFGSFVQGTHVRLSDLDVAVCFEMLPRSSASSENIPEIDHHEFQREVLCMLENLFKTDEKLLPQWRVQDCLPLAAVPVLKLVFEEALVLDISVRVARFRTGSDSQSASAAEFEALNINLGADSPIHPIIFQLSSDQELEDVRREADETASQMEGETSSVMTSTKTSSVKLVEEVDSGSSRTCSKDDEEADLRERVARTKNNKTGPVELASLGAGGTEPSNLSSPTSTPAVRERPEQSGAEPQQGNIKTSTSVEQAPEVRQDSHATSCSSASSASAEEELAASEKMHLQIGTQMIENDLELSNFSQTKSTATGSKDCSLKSCGGQQELISDAEGCRADEKIDGSATNSSSTSSKLNLNYEAGSATATAGGTSTNPTTPAFRATIQKQSQALLLSSTALVKKRDQMIREQFWHTASVVKTTVYAVKHWSKCEGLNCTYKGGLNSLSWLLLVFAHYKSTHPHLLHVGAESPEPPTHHIPKHIANFYFWLSNLTDQNQTVHIDMEHIVRCYPRGQQDQAEVLYIEDPMAKFNIFNNTAQNLLPHVWKQIGEKAQAEIWRFTPERIQEVCRNPSLDDLKRIEASIP